MDYEFLNLANNYIGSTKCDNVEYPLTEKYTIKSMKIEKQKEEDFTRYIFEEKNVLKSIKEDYNQANIFSKIQFTEFSKMLVSILSILTSFAIVYF